MVVTNIYVLRHGLRAPYTVDPQTGKYYSATPIPTGLDGDVPLAAAGEAQAVELAAFLPTLGVSRVYSSPFFRCLQTIAPFATGSNWIVRADRGLGEWYGRARFGHPIPASLSTLKGFFPFIEENWPSSIVPDGNGETVHELHSRIAFALSVILAKEDAEDEAEGREQERSILIATHAASMIAIGRTLTGRMPDVIAEDDFKTFTAGVSRFTRKAHPKIPTKILLEWTPIQGIPTIDWRDGKGVAGGWECVLNSTTDHLKHGPENAWTLAEAQTFV